jgi:hypothetical protein
MKANQSDSWGWDEALALFGGEDALLASASQHKALLRKREVKREKKRGRFPFVPIAITQVLQGQRV